jgi:hypothetical protein
MNPYFSILDAMLLISSAVVLRWGSVSVTFTGDASDLWYRSIFCPQYAIYTSNRSLLQEKMVLFNINDTLDTPSKAMKMYCI